MRKVLCWSATFVLLAIIFAQSGCWFGKDANPSGPQVQQEPLAIGSAQSVNFKFILPERKQPLGEKSDSLIREPVPEPSIMALTGATPTVTFKLILVNVGNSKNPTTTLSKTVSVDANGTAKTSFEAIPALTVIGNVHIENGHYGGFSDFHGAVDLIASAVNSIAVNPIGSNGPEDAIAQVVEYVVFNPKLFSKVNSNFASTVRSKISDLDSSSSDFSQNALAKFIQYLAPPVQTITPEQVMQAQQNLVNTGAVPNAPSSYWQAGETSMTNWNLDVSNFLGAGSPTISLSSSSLRNFSIRQNVILPSQFSWRFKDGRDWMSPIRFQGGYGTCVAFAVCGSMEAMMRIQGNISNPDLSEYYLFYNGNEGNAHLSDGRGWWFTPALDYLKNYGVVSEFVCPYSLIPN